jgi:hypothetical protein
LTQLAVSATGPNVGVGVSVGISVDVGGSADAGIGVGVSVGISVDVGGSADAGAETSEDAPQAELLNMTKIRKSEAIVF